MTSYSQDRNDDIFFELLKAMPGNPIPLRQQIRPELLHRLIEQHPSATLQQLCELVKLKSGVSLSITSMSRLLRQQGLTCKRGGSFNI
jgi:transposase